MLSCPSRPSGMRLVHVEGPQRYTAHDVASTLSDLTGRTIAAEAVPRRSGCRPSPAVGWAGATPSWWRRMFDARNAGPSTSTTRPTRRGAATPRLREVLALAARPDGRYPAFGQRMGRRRIRVDPRVHPRGPSTMRSSSIRSQRSSGSWPASTRRRGDALPGRVVAGVRERRGCRDGQRGRAAPATPALRDHDRPRPVLGAVRPGLGVGLRARRVAAEHELPARADVARHRRAQPAPEHPQVLVLRDVDLAGSTRAISSPSTSAKYTPRVRVERTRPPVSKYHVTSVERSVSAASRETAWARPYLLSGSSAAQSFS